MNKKILLATTAILSSAVLPVPQLANAGIKCAGPNQVTSHGLISTPYCQDVYLAHIAGYSPKAILYNPSAKEEACNAVGNDNRVSYICAGYGFQNDVFRR